MILSQILPCYNIVLYLVPRIPSSLAGHFDLTRNNITYCSDKYGQNNQS